MACKDAGSEGLKLSRDSPNYREDGSLDIGLKQDSDLLHGDWMKGPGALPGYLAAALFTVEGREHASNERECAIH